MPIQVLLLKLSGEALRGDGDGVFSQDALARAADEIRGGVHAGRRAVAVVVGGGNILRGRELPPDAADPCAGDRLGMLATLINALALRDAPRRAGARAEVMAPWALPDTCHAWDRDRALAWLAEGVVLVLGGGTGHPFFTTDTTAALRGAQLGASVLLKASTVDGIYDRDPRRHPDATRFEHLSFDQALAGRYAVMDQTAFALCRERQLPIRVFAAGTPGAIAAALGEHPPGTLVSGETP